MKFSSLSSLALACTSIFAHPVEHNEEHSDIKARQQNYVRLEGGKGNAVQPRLEVRQLKNQQPDQWNIFLVALDYWMTQSTGEAGYYGISTIHGVPRQNYADVAQCSTCAGADGYCPHDSVLFPAWHRAYVALFEQEFLKVALDRANQFPAATRQRYVNAATNLRFPYFDWAAVPPNNGPALPTLITDSSVTFQGPNGQQTVRNPLYGYVFRNGEQSGLLYATLNTYTKTLRYPKSNDPNAANNSPQCAAAFAGSRQSLQDQIYQLFTACDNYLYFSNDDSSDSSGRCSNSLEAIHNTVHNNAGGLGGNGISGGHMTYLSTASYDPIFWLHHANVDRLAAMWQTIHSNSYGASQIAPHNTWTVAQGSNQGPTSGLRPFRRPGTSTSFWTTNQVRDWRQFGYTYPEFSNSDGSAGAITGYVNALYGPNPSATAGSSKREAAADPSLLGGVSKVLDEPNILSSLGDILADNPLKASNGSLYQYVANIKTARYALGGSYTIFLFNGSPVSEDVKTWPTDPNLYGPMGVLAQEMSGSGMNMSLITSSSIPLTTKLTSLFGSGVLGSLSELVVAPYLKENLQWRIAKDGSSVDPSTIPGFVVTVVTSSAQPAADAKSFPVYSPFIELLGITQDMAGGASETQYGPPSY